MNIFNEEEMKKIVESYMRKSLKLFEIPKLANHFKRWAAIKSD